MSAPMLRLRGYQREALDAIDASLQEFTRVACVLPTGAGKTVLFAHLIERSHRKGMRALVLVHREELAEQAKAKVHSVAPHLTVGIVKAERNEVDADVIVASIQTLAHPRRRESLLDDPGRRGPIGIVICDEGHHVVAKTWRATLEAFGCFADPEIATPCVGFTATLTRTDGLGLGDVWQTVAYEKDILWMIDNGYLTDVRGQQVTVDGLDLATVARSRGDYQEGQLGEAMEASGAGEIIAEAYREHASIETGVRRGVLFTPTVATAYSFAQSMRDAGIRAETIEGNTSTEDRKLIYKKYEAGEVDVLANAMVLTEGWDAPWAEVAVIARPTQSAGLYCLDEQTEILTDQGWKGIDDDLGDARPASYNISDDSIHWSPLLGCIERKLGADEMYALSSPTADFRVSAHHRMVWRDRRNGWRIGEIDDLAKRRSNFLVPIAGFQDAPGVQLTDDELRFIGWYITDGTLNKTTKAISICQAEHQPWNADIVKMLDGCNFKYSVYRAPSFSQYKRGSELLRYTISRGAPRGTRKERRGWAAVEPYISKDLAPALEDVTREQLLVLLEAMHLGDGAKQVGQTWTRRSYHISTGNKVMADRLQSLCVRRGMKCNVATHTYNENPLYVLHIKDVSQKWVGGQNDRDRESITLSRSTWGERIWCVETDAGTIVTRRNGKVLIMGNCQMVGRVLRPWQGKEEALVLDVVGISSAHKLQSLTQLLKTHIEDGESYAEAVARLEKEMKAGLEKKTLAGVVAAKQVELFANSHSTWLQTRGGIWFIPVKAGVFFLWPEFGGPLDGTYRLGYKKQYDRKRVGGPQWGRALETSEFFAQERENGWIHQGLTLEYAMAWGEELAESDDPTISLKDRAWRRTKPSQAQTDYALRLKVADPETVFELRKGALSDLISIAVASKMLDVK